MPLRLGSRPGLVAWFLAGVILLLAMVGMLAPHALLPSAAADPACVDDNYGVVGAIEDQDTSYSDNSRGTQADVYVSKGPTICQRISTIYVLSENKRGFVEFGWTIGFFRCSGDPTGSTYLRPHAFYVARDAFGGDYYCSVLQLATAYPHEESFDHFTISDSNANSIWNLNFNGDYLFSVDVDFTRGWNITGMERATFYDSCYARWADLYEHHDTDGWSYWDDANRYTDSDQDCHYHRENAHHVAVLQGN